MSGWTTQDDGNVQELMSRTRGKSLEWSVYGVAGKTCSNHQAKSGRVLSDQSSRRLSTSRDRRGEETLKCPKNWRWLNSNASVSGTIRRECPNSLNGWDWRWDSQALNVKSVRPRSIQHVLKWETPEFEAAMLERHALNLGPDEASPFAIHVCLQDRVE